MNWVDEFIEMLLPLDKHKMNIEGAYMLKHQHLPKSIFKFRTITEFSMRNLEEDTIWLSDPSKFNDPYDCIHTVNQAVITQVRAKEFLPIFIREKGLEKKISSDLVETILENKNPLECFMDFLLTDKLFDDKIKFKEVMLAASEKLNEDMLRIGTEYISSSFKLCSFSERYDSILMWSHYSNNHQGFCLEYDITNIPYGDHRTRFLFPVIYSENMFDSTEHMLKNINDESFNNLYFTRAALIKAIDWQYEKEWRLVFANGYLDKAQPYFMGTPKTLYLGSKISPDDQKDLIEICKRKNIPVYKMKTHMSKFSVEPTTIEDAEQFFFKK